MSVYFSVAYISMDLIYKQMNIGLEFTPVQSQFVSLGLVQLPLYFHLLEQ